MTLPPLPELRTAAQAAHIALTCISTHPTLDMSDYLRGRVDAAAAGLEAALAAVPAQPVSSDVLREALSFYADETRYHGPNQTLDAADKWTEQVGLKAYRLDVTRDRGVIAKKALAAAPQAVPVPAWQPIETAPKDRDVLVACSHGLYVARYCDHGIEWWHVDDNKHGPFPLRGSSPTHWMPLPAAPKEQP